MSQKLICHFYCNFCEDDVSKELTQEQLNKTSLDCEQCYRKLTVTTSAPDFDPNMVHSPTNQDIAAVLSQVSTTMLQPTPLQANRPTRRQQAMLPIHQIISSLLTSFGSSIEEDVEGCSDDFINNLQKHQNVMTPHQLYQISLAFHTTNNTELVFPTVAEFGFNKTDLIDLLVQLHPQRFSASPDSKSPTRLSETIVSSNKPSITLKQQQILNSYTFSPLDHTTFPTRIYTPDESYLLSTGYLYQGTPPTGKELNQATYTQQIDKFLLKVNHSSQLPLSNTTSSPIFVFQRGDINFGAKSKLLPPHHTSKANALDSLPLLPSSRTMIVCDTNLVWPFVMSDSTRSADQDCLALMISAADTTRLGLSDHLSSPPLPHPQCSILLTPNETLDCSICQCVFECHDAYVKLACKHIFHMNCLLPWVEKKSTCPVCRFRLPPKVPIDDTDAPRTVNFDHFFL